MLGLRLGLGFIFYVYFVSSLLPPPSWQQNRLCLLYITGQSRPKNKL